jgi:predicted MFS family arabinose efflux permease
MTGQRRSLLLMIAVILALGIAHLGTATMPFQVGALMDGRGISASAAGLFGLFEIGAQAAVMILSAPVIHRARPVTVGVGGTLLAAIANFLLYATYAPLPVLLLLGGIAGIGYGLVFAASITGASAADNPDRTYSVGNGGAVAFVVATMLIMPNGALYFGAAGPFLAVAAILLLAVPTMFAFQARAGLPGGADGRMICDPPILSFLILWGAYSLGSGAMWSFAERIARSIHLSAEATSVILSATTAAGVVGASLAALSAGRVPRIPAMIVGLVGTASSFLIMAFATGPVAYAIGALSYWIFNMFQYPLFLGVAASLDPNGRIGTMGGGCERCAFAVGAPIAGLVIDHGSIPALGICAFILCLAPIPICLPIVARTLRLMQRSAGPATPSSPAMGVV